MTLTDFLLARIAEDEAAARAASGAPAYDAYGDTAAEESIEMARNEGCNEAGPAHFDRWLPARVLAECGVKRRIVESPYDFDSVLRYLALPYADHADYREEWRP